MSEHSLTRYSSTDHADYRPLTAEDVPTRAASETAQAGDAAKALAYLERQGALDLADMLGLVA